MGVKVSYLRAFVIVLIFIVPTCTQTRRPVPPEDDSSRIEVQVASYDLAVGEQRFMVGLITPDQELVSYGTIQMEFAFLGTKDSPVDPQAGPSLAAEFLPIPLEASEPEPPGPPPAGPVGPVAGPASRGRGVYAAGVAFDRAGFWQVGVVADLAEGGRRTGLAAFEVFERHKVPAPGEAAPRTENLTLDSSDAPPGAIDSRAQQGEISDPELHRTTIAGALSQGRPVLAVFSTPVYCLSRFCGPITDMVSGLARDHAGRAEFIHVEIWRDFQNQEINKAAAEWLLRDGDLQEPWVFLIGGDGIIIARWDNVATRGEIEPLLGSLPSS